MVLFGIIKEKGLDCNECEQFYLWYYQTTQRKDQETQVYREPTEKQLKKGITFQDVIDKFEQEKDLLDTWNGYLSFARFRRLFILALYRYLPPLRGQDLFSLKVVRDKSPDDMGNYIDIQNDKLVLRDYKKSKSYGTREISLSTYEELTHCIVRYTNDAGISDGDYLLVKHTKSKEPINSKMFCNDLNTILGVSVNYLRNMYISSFLENYKKQVADGTITQQVMNEKRKESAR